MPNLSEIDPEFGSALVAGLVAVLVGIFAAWWESRSRRELVERQAELDRQAATDRAGVERKALLQKAELDRDARTQQAELDRDARTQQAELDREAAMQRASLAADERVQQARLDRHDDAVGAFVVVLRAIPDQLGAIATGEPAADQLMWGGRMDAARAMCLSPSQDLADLMLEILVEIEKFQKEATELRERAFRLADAADRDRQAAEEMAATGEPGSGNLRISAAYYDGSAERELSTAETTLLRGAQELQAQFWRYFAETAMPGLRAT